MNSTMFSSVQERLQSRRGRKRWKRDFWGPQGGGDHRGKRYFKGSVRGCELVRKRLNPQLWSRLLALCVYARWWNLCFEFKVAVSRFLPWFILILLWLIDKCSLYERIHIHKVLSQCCPRYFLLVGYWWKQTWYFTWDKSGRSCWQLSDRHPHKFVVWSGGILRRQETEG